MSLIALFYLWEAKEICALAALALSVLVDRPRKKNVLGTNHAAREIVLTRFSCRRMNDTRLFAFGSVYIVYSAQISTAQELCRFSTCFEQTTYFGVVNKYRNKNTLLIEE